MGKFIRYSFTSHEEDILNIGTIDLPKKSSKDSLTYDIKSAVDKVINPHSVTLIPTGLACQLNKHEELQIRGTYDLSIRGILSVNGTNAIDSDYKGHIMLLLYNTTAHPYKISAGDRIAKGAFIKYIVDDNESEE